jgi:hypothetical protein
VHGHHHERSKSDANAFVTATTWNINTDPVARVTTLMSLFLKALEAGKWVSGGLVLSIPNAVVPASALQFHAARIDAGFKVATTGASLKVKRGGEWHYACITYNVPHDDGCPREFIVRFPVEGNFDVNGFQVYVAWAGSDIMVDTIQIAYKHHWYSPFYDARTGASRIDAIWLGIEDTPTSQAKMDGYHPHGFPARLPGGVNAFLELIDAAQDDAGIPLRD